MTTDVNVVTFVKIVKS